MNMNLSKKGQAEERDHLHQGDQPGKSTMEPVGWCGLIVRRQPVFLEHSRETGRQERQMRPKDLERLVCAGPHRLC